MRNHHAVIEALERKANDRAVTEPERDALLAKASELRAAHGAPPIKPPRSPRIAAPAGDGWHFSSGTTGTTPSTGTFTIVTHSFG